MYGDIEAPLEADETFPLTAEQSYAASKAAADLLALSYVRTFGLPVVITRASNNYGPYQFPEKLIPLMISNAIERTPLPVYGDGLQVRDWLYVDDHCRGHPGSAGARPRRRGLQHRGQLCADEPEVISRVLDIVGAPETLDVHRRGPPGSRPAVCAQLREDCARNRLCARRSRSTSV